MMNGKETNLDVPHFQSVAHLKRDIVVIVRIIRIERRRNKDCGGRVRDIYLIEIELW